jgi:hypothetical protein
MAGVDQGRREQDLLWRWGVKGWHVSPVKYDPLARERLTGTASLAVLPVSHLPCLARQPWAEGDFEVADHG